MKHDDIRKKKSVLLIGPPPYKDGGAWISFDLMHQYMRKIPHLQIYQIVLPVHYPLYNENGSITSTNHPRTLFRLLRAIVQIPRVNNIVIFGSFDVCFSYGLVIILCAKLFRKYCAIRIAGGRGLFSAKILPVFIRSLCLFLAQSVDLIVTQTNIARNDLPVNLQSKTIVVKGFRPMPLLESKSNHRTDKGIKFVCVGRGSHPKKKQSVEDDKGLDVLLDAVDLIYTSLAQGKHEDMVNDITFHIYGSISYIIGERIQRMPNVTAHGYVNNARLRDLLQQYDVLVFPSRFDLEGHPGIIIETFMAAKPIIASDLPGPSEIVCHEVNSLIVKTGDVDSLAAAIIKLATDSALRWRLAAGSRASASDFDQDKIIPDLVNNLTSPIK